MSGSRGGTERTGAGDAPAAPAPAGDAGPRTSRPTRRAVRPGTGAPDPLVDLRSADDTDLGWQVGADQDNDDDRLRREVPPHW